ncbi:RNA polymerase subunit sigma-70 [Methyloprofundus sedimenti]|uniref:RNA polymerase subunit sigma-70 n=1 Tax=Methyloprofundus sedimenti TaxID=1420851 RepID=A0A1V8M4D2_9GAMM|nr:sigma-70 family RNA polymerase sigma factor [Methyloprofundus sedimenti]OQK16427.1 RNA polymerase subunit sigma-70 [Methyloprofundus sedimenti]
MHKLNPVSIAELLTEHHHALNRFATHKLGSPDAASDVLQDAYLRLANSQQTEKINNPRAFVFRIVSNLIIDYQRKSVNRILHETDDQILHSIPDPQALEISIEGQQRLALINEALAQLPEKCRQAFYLNRVEGYTHKEVAEKLQLSESMIAKHLVRAMRHCREHLKQNL